MASIAVEMLTLSHCRKMMVFNPDLGLDSDTDTELVNTVNGLEGKRMLSEVEEDQEKGHVKKRRKQSKPVRIASSESLSDEENGISESERSNLKVIDDSTSFCKTPTDDNVNLINHNSNDDEYQMKTDRTRDQEETIDSSLLPINLSNAKCPQNDILTSYVNTQANHRGSAEVMGQSFQEPNFDGSHFERDSLFATSSSPLSLPTAKAAHNVHPSNTTRHSGSPIRIFNPEAFCDLCNKEFCNKYFLKTHKANKHGIYSENVGPNLIDALPSLPFINYFSNVSEVLPSASQIPRSVLRKPPQLPLSLSQQNPVFLQKSVAANGNTRAFCNICQREFCNKYFVRRHKAKIHGIIDTSYPDTPPGELQELKSQSTHDMKSCVGNHEKSEDHEIYPTFAEHQATSGLSSGSINDIDRHDQRSCENRAYPSNVDQQNSIKHNRETDSEGCISPDVPATYIDDTAKEIDQTEKNKRIGNIANSEAFCDICCKEYCNKYFLRTHKMRSHGITQPDWEKKDDRINVFENSLIQCNNQNAPLNLIIGDQAVEKSENDTAHVENGAIFCNVCGQRFKDIFLLKMHTSYAHPQGFYERNFNHENSNLVENEKVVKGKQIIKTEFNAGSEPGNKIVNFDEKRFGIDFQISSILRCEICHKNFDASSLETHIESEHGSLLDEVGILTEENSDSQTFQKELKYDCASCHRQFSSSSWLNQHIIDCHNTTGEQSPPSNIINAKAVKEIEEPSQKDCQLPGILNATEIQAAPTSSFCEICKKELCNKYFMKTHMQRMHGISIDNGAHIGGVVCDICNKELCSKYFLRVHKQNSHGIVDEILGLDFSRNQSPGTDPSLRPSEQSDLNNRYFSHFTEVCTICSRRFRSMKWLKAHLLNDHGDEGKDKWKEFQTHYEFKLDRFSQELQKKTDPTSAAISSANSNGGMMTMRNYNEGYSQKMDVLTGQSDGSEENVKKSVFTTIFNGKSTNTKQYHCSYCPFSTCILAFLFVHERSHINGSSSFIEQSKKMQCKICSLTFENEDDYEKHCVSHQSSEINSSTINEFGTNQNDRLNKSDTVEPENATTADPSDVHGGPLDYKGIARCTKGKELKSDDFPGPKNNHFPTYNGPRQEFDRGEPDFIESFCEDSRKEYVGRDAEDVDDEVNVALIRVKQSLELIANKTDIPVTFSLPQNQKQVIMQPFVLEDSGQFLLNDVKKTGFKKSFLSSIVFLPVTERLTNPVTVSFKLTPTL